MFEDENQNALCESLALFELLMIYPFFREAMVILFFNKIDLFTEKIRKVHLGDYFSTFTGKIYYALTECTVEAQYNNYLGTEGVQYTEKFGILKAVHFPWTTHYYIMIFNGHFTSFLGFV